MKKWVLALGAGVLGLVAVVGVRTATFAPAAVADAAGITVADPPPFDANAAAQNLGAAIRFQTVSHQDPAENQADQWTGLQQWLVSTYPKAHAAMQRELVGGALLYTWQGSDPAAQPIILMAHQDVVPVTPGTEQDWKHPPFAGTIADGAVWGRGAIDDKGALIGLFEALEALAAQGFKPKRTIYLVSGHDEEVGGTGAQAVAEALAARKVKALFTIDEGGAILAKAPVIDGPAMMIGVAEKGYVTLKVTANAIGGHSSTPPELDKIGSVNLARAVVAIAENPFPMELRGPAASMLEVLGDKAGGLTRVAVANRWLFGPMLKSKFAETPASAALLHTTIAPTMLTGSPKENVLPQSANALINYRIAPWDTSKTVLDRAKQAVAGMPVDVAFLTPPREPSPVSSSTSPGWKLLYASALADHPGVVATPYLVAGGTDSRNMTAVSDDVYRFQAMTFDPEGVKMIHGTNEHLTVKNLESTIRFFARLVATAAG